ncbi:sphingomyelin phosphodiesterase-like [Contarinia nasturtii]|uniref:sphingomyelin phosphodiesterase-like n=1 Tax=Contarinia nasturtii TaxID=265458 RepID=UPI0012D43A7F|nr:sphingomyelin phosphodiesterase-like [Contarinia nasturtii]
MKCLLKIVVIIFVLKGSNISVTNGLYLLGGSDDVDLMSNTSDILSNYCESCKWGVALLNRYLKAGESDERILTIGIKLCITLKIQTPNVCELGIRLFGQEIIRLAKIVNMTSSEVCYFILDDMCEESVVNERHTWNVSLKTLPKPKVREIPLPKENAPKLKVLHISDTHMDPLYLEGSNAACNEPLCCRETDGQANSTYSAAGKWGDYRCDLPTRTIEHFLNHIMETHKDIDYVIWTGDVVPHDVWIQTNVELMNVIEETIILVSEKLPGIKVFPAIGNHERAPANFFPTSNQDSSISLFYNDIDTLWSRWLSINTSRTLRKGAFYSTLVRHGLRIISLNMNVCSNLNFWLLTESKDPSEELEWLINELQSAENANEKVHIIGHIPPGNQDCLRIWSHNYYDIIARFENTVAAQFFGHTHFDEFEVFYDPKNLSRATNIAYVGPSLTSYWDLNPGYRIYYIDGDHNDTTRMVVDHETWILDLEEANILNNPIWRKSYSAKHAYSMKGLRPIDWDGLIKRMENDDDLFDLYFRNYWKQSPFRPECDTECKRDILCQAKSGRSHDKSHLCPDLKTIPHETGPDLTPMNAHAEPLQQLSIVCIWIYSLYVLTTICCRFT